MKLAQLAGGLQKTCHLRQQQSILRAGPARLNRANQYQAGPSVPCAGARQSSRALASNSAASQTTADRRGPKPSWNIKMLYDGDCPLCMREVNMLQRRDAGQDRIAFVNIGAEDYDPRQNAGISYEQAMGNIHAILPDGKVVTNVEVFQRLYEQVGLGWIYAFARIGPLKAAAERVYAFWAKYRLPLTRRPDLATVLADKEKKTCRGSS